MSITVITLGTNLVNLVAMPTTPGLKSVQFDVSDSVGAVTSTFTGQMQTQSWPGGEKWTGTMTLPPLEQADADAWISFLMELRGMQNAFQIGDPLKAVPRGSPTGVPVVNGSGPSGGNPAMSQAIDTSGWTPSASNLLLTGDYIQVGFRLYRVLEPVNADTSGNATIPIWPSLREVPTAGATIITTDTTGLFRLATNKRTWSADETFTTALSFQIQEYR